MDKISNSNFEISSFFNKQLSANEFIYNWLKETETTWYSGKLSKMSDALKSIVNNFRVLGFRQENADLQR